MTMSRTMLNERSPDDWFEPESDDNLFQGPDSLCFSEGNDITLQAVDQAQPYNGIQPFDETQLDDGTQLFDETQPDDGIQPFDGTQLFDQTIAFDQPPATTCDETQSSLDLFLDSSTSLNARDLADEFPGLGELTAPLNQIKDSECRVPVDQQTGNSGSGQPPLPNDDDNQEPNFQPPVENSPRRSYRSGMGNCNGWDGLFRIPLCCDGASKGSYVYGCDPCKFLIISDLPVTEDLCT